MLAIALRRLWSRPGLALLSVVGVTLAVGLVISIPVFAKAVSFVMLCEELNQVSTASGRPPFSVRIYVLPSGQYPLSLETAEVWENHVAETLVSEVGLPLVAKSRQMESMSLVLRTRDQETPYGPAHTVLLPDASIAVLPGVGSRLTVVDGEPWNVQASSGELDVWMHYTLADEMGLHAGERLEVRDQRQDVSIPVRVAGTWKATDPGDAFWFEDPDVAFRRALLVRHEDYRALAEPVLQQQLGFASWYLVLDGTQLTSVNMKARAEGLRAAKRLIEHYLPDPRMDSSPLQALDTSLQREADLTALMFVFSVPLMGFLLYFLSLLSTITIRWQQREVAILVSRGMRSDQLLAVSVVEACLLVGLGLLLGAGAGVQLAQVLGYAQSFMQFTWRAPLPVSLTALNVPMLLAALCAALVARLWPVVRSMRTSVVAHERGRARARQRPFWQRFYVDFSLLVPLAYAYHRLSTAGTLVPSTSGGEGETAMDPLMFLVPALFTLTMSLLLVRLFPLLMRAADWLAALGRQPTLYLAFRQLARQSGQYTSALLLVITSLSLGAFMASMAVSLDKWLLEQVYYAVGSDVLIRQMINPEDAEAGVTPTEGAWVLPVGAYRDVPGVTDATRVGMYPASIALRAGQSIKGTFVGVDRLDLSRVLFFRPDFAHEPLGGLMNELASRQDAVLLSERMMQQGRYEVGDQISIYVSLLNEIGLATKFTIAGTYDYFPTVYEQGDDGQTAIIGNLDFLFDQVGGPMIHNIWLTIAPEADKRTMRQQVEGMGVFVNDWIEAREAIAQEQARVERVGIFGTLTVGFLGAAVFSGIGLLIYNYASLQERLFRFTILRAVGLSLLQVVSQVSIEYVVLMVYSVAGGVAIGVWASRQFVPFFQAADQSVLRPPMLTPLVAWQEIGQISGAFTLVLIVAQVIVISSALRKGVFQALRMGDQE